MTARVRHITDIIISPYSSIRKCMLKPLFLYANVYVIEVYVIEVYVIDVYIIDVYAIDVYVIICTNIS